MEANLLITYEPAHAGKAREEVSALLKSVDEDANFLESEIEGIFLLRTKKNPKDVTKKLISVCKKNPDKFQYTFKWVPIDKWTSSDLDDMIKVMKEFDKKMDEKKKWKMDLEKRRYDMPSTDLIIKLTDHINKPKVDLKNPDVIVKVEIIGDKAGLSLLNADELLDAQKLKKL